jgi:hypothetical protein
MTDPLSAARSLRTTIKGVRHETEAARRLPTPVVDILIETRLCRLTVPESLGGREAEPLVSGRWSLVSGCELADWIPLLCVVTTDGGEPIMLAAGVPEMRMAYTQKGSYEIIDSNRLIHSSKKPAAAHESAGKTVGVGRATLGSSYSGPLPFN